MNINKARAYLYRNCNYTDQGELTYASLFELIDGVLKALAEDEPINTVKLYAICPHCKKPMTCSGPYPIKDKICDCGSKRRPVAGEWVLLQVDEVQEDHVVVKGKCAYFAIDDGYYRMQGAE